MKAEHKIPEAIGKEVLIVKNKQNPDLRRKIGIIESQHSQTMFVVRFEGGRSYIIRECYFRMRCECKTCPTEWFYGMCGAYPARMTHTCNPCFLSR